MRADLARSAGDLETARHSLRLGLVYDPSSVDLHLALARVLMDLGDGEPERLIERAIQLDPSRAGAWAAKGDLLVRHGKKRPAERAYQRALRLEPATSEGRHAATALASLYRESGRADLARRSLERLAELGGPEGLFLLAAHDLDEGRSRDAEESMLTVAERADPDLLRRVAERLAWLMRFELAFRLYEKSLRDEDQRHFVTDFELRSLLHLALLAGNEAAALRTYERLSARAGPSERRRAARSLISSGRGPLLREFALHRPKDTPPEEDLILLGLEAAVGGPGATLLKRATEAGAPAARVLLADAHSQRGDQDAARVELEPMTKLDPAVLVAALGPEMFERLCALLLRLHPASGSRFLEALSSRVRARVIAARVAFTSKAQLQAASLLSDEEVESDPEALCLLSRLELSSERRKRVEDRVDVALLREPQRADLWRARARLYLERDERGRAKVALGRSLFYEPELEEDAGLVRALLSRDSSDRGIRP
jgi:tetratricopeptide (TPR) repeat protein